MPNILAFDIETIPDVDGGRKLYGLGDLDDTEGVDATRYWEAGDEDREFKWNNYLNRFHYRHTDLMDVLAGYQPRASAPLDQIAVLCGLPGKLGMDGSKVWNAYQAGQFADVRDYCETDSLNTYLLYLRWELMRGNLTQSKFGQECEMVRGELEKQDKAHFNRFLQAWEQAQL